MPSQLSPALTREEVTSGPVPGANAAQLARSDSLARWLKSQTV